MKEHNQLTLFILFLLFTLSACNVNDSDKQKMYKDYTGTLTWHGSPAVDGAGMLFYTGNKTFGVTGDTSDYDNLFDEDSYEIEIRADFFLTGNKTIRGWGTEFTEAVLVDYKKISQISD